MKRQHQKIEAQLKKYNEILNSQKVKKDQNLKNKIEALLKNGTKNNAQADKGKNDFMKIYGVGINGSGVPAKGKVEAVKSMEGGISKLPQLKIGKKKKCQILFALARTKQESLIFYIAPAN